MLNGKTHSEFIHHLLTAASKPGDRLPSLNELSTELGLSVGKLREQMEVARVLGLVEVSPRRGIVRAEYNFLHSVRLSLLTALTIDRTYFDAFSSLRSHLEVAYWHEAVALLTQEDKEHLCALIATAWAKLNHPRAQIPYQEHREFHLTIFRRLENPFVLGLLEAYWDAYEAVELNTYADYRYLEKVWQYHERIVDAICANDYELGQVLLVEHMRLLSNRGISMETTASL
ncbi:MAG: FadR family transcriptional regulator [Caldilineaceae bacterium]|nr:FadR family transcriptional regulator [Caldilineaceae bacterium]